MRRYKFANVIIVFFLIWQLVAVFSKVFAWTAGPTGICCDADGSCGPCREAPADEPSSSSEDVYMPPDSDFTPRISEAQRRRNESNVINEQCVAYANNKDYDSAIPCYERALAVDPTNEVVQSNLKKAKALKANAKGIEYYTDRDWSQAAQYFKEALSYMPNDANIKENLRKTENMLKFEEQEQAEKDAKEKFAGAKVKIDKMLDNLSGDFDKEKPSSSPLEFMDAGQTLFEKGAPGATPVDLTFMGTGKPPAVKPPGVKEEAVPVSPEFKEEMARLDKEYWDLEEAIKKEKDPIKRAELINKQSYIRSQIGVLELKILDVYKEEERAREAFSKLSEKEQKVEALTMLAAAATNIGDFNSALKNLNIALKEMPQDKGIQKAINFVQYIKDMAESKVFNPRYPVLIDALSYGKGDWNKTISYLGRAAKDNPDDLALRDAINVIEGIKSHSEVSESDMERRRDDVRRLTEAAVDATARNDFGKAYKMLQLAADLDPNDLGVRDALHFTIGVLGERTGMVPAREEPTALDVDDLSKPPRRDDVQKLISKAFEDEINHNYEEALRSFREAHALDPEDLVVRDEMNYLEGICSERASKKK